MNNKTQKPRTTGFNIIRTIETTAQMDILTSLVSTNTTPRQFILAYLLRRVQRLEASSFSEGPKIWDKLGRDNGRGQKGR
jgi:hypothetical protein